MVERGSADLAAAWGDAGRGIDVGAGVPKELVLRVELPGCTSAAGMELELEKKSISLCIPGGRRSCAPCIFVARCIVFQVVAATVDCWLHRPNVPTLSVRANRQKDRENLPSLV